MRYLTIVAVIFVLAGCGASSASPTPPSVATAGAPTATAVKPATHTMSFSHAPKMMINKRGRYTAIVTTTDGIFSIQLLPSVAPIAVNSFVFLARRHFFDGVTFHRIVANFIIQTGDPTGTGTGGPGYSFPNEPVRQKYTPGTVAMANHGVNTNGSQFFIVVGSGASGLPPNYTIFGRISSGMDVVDKISRTPVGPNAALNGEMSAPLKPVLIKTLTVTQT